MLLEPTDQDRCSQVTAVMAAVRDLVSLDSFEVVRPARWRHKPTGKEVETGYTRGEGRVRIYKGRSRTPMVSITFLGSSSDNVQQVIDALYPPPVAA